MPVLSAGAKLSYGTLGSGGALPTTWNDLTGCTQIPDIGGAPDTLDTTTLDNTTYQTGMPGLVKLDTLEFPFNLENPASGANINTIAGLTKTQTYGWKITYASGITVTFKSKPKYKLNSVGVNEIEKFTLYLVPEEEPVTSIPSASV